MKYVILQLVLAMMVSVSKSIMIDLNEREPFCLTDLEEDHMDPHFIARVYPAFYNQEQTLNVTVVYA